MVSMVTVLRKPECCSGRRGYRFSWFRRYRGTKIPLGYLFLKANLPSEKWRFERKRQMHFILYFFTSYKTAKRVFLFGIENRKFAML